MIKAEVTQEDTQLVSDDIIEEFIQKKQELDEYVRKHGEAAITGYFKKVFEKYPQLFGISVVQYTPYFMDGDPCVFGIQALGVLFYDDAKYGLPSVAQVNNPDLTFCTDWSCDHENDPDPNIFACYDGAYEVPGSWNIKMKMSNLEKAGEEVPASMVAAFGIAKDIETVIHNSQDIMLMVFGDHVQITVTRKEVTVEEFNHD